MTHPIRLAAVFITASAIISAAQSAFTGRLLVSPDWSHSKTSSVATIQESFARILDQTHTTGTNASQMSAVIQLTGALTNSQDVTHELAAGIANSFGDTIAFTRVNVLALRASTANLGDIHLGAAPATPFASWISDTNAVAIIKPGGLILLTAPDATGYPSTGAGSLRILNATTNPAAYTLIIGGAQ
jgi:hypothetical protein